MTNKIDCLIENANENYEIDVQQWTETAQKLFNNLMTHEEVKSNSCLVGLDFDEVFFDITFTDSAETHELNRTYREKDYPADIITFALFADSEDDLIIERRIVLGDIIIALDKVEEMAKEEGKTFDWELKFLIAHGILHLLGFDHQTEDEYNFVVKHQIEAINDDEV
ncbi:MAG: rRNA maturation RNase YbeY [Fusobacterium sp.]|nr:rRNA maturation RNase YbeY [Fusobacterium sp.]